MRTLILTAAIVAAATAAFGQLETPLKARVPFSFEAAGVDARAGDCKMTVNHQGQVRFSTLSGDFLRTGRRDSRATAAVRMVFRNYGDKAVLRAIELGPAGSVQFDTTATEKSWINLGMTARVEMVPLVRSAD